jgi:hypothetical protein
MATSIDTGVLGFRYLEPFNESFQFDPSGICRLRERSDRTIARLPFPLYSICLSEEEFVKLFFDKAGAQEEDSVVLANIETIPPFSESLYLRLSFDDFVADVSRTKLTHFNTACFPIQGDSWAVLFDNLDDCAYVSRAP